VYIGIKVLLSELIEYGQHVVCKEGHAQKEPTDNFCSIDGGKFTTIPKPPFKPTKMLKKILSTCPGSCDSVDFNASSLENLITFLKWPLCSYRVKTYDESVILIGKLLMKHNYYKIEKIEDIIDSIREIKSKVAELNGRSIGIFNEARAILRSPSISEA
jgi:hypothetical protein